MGDENGFSKVSIEMERIVNVDLERRSRISDELTSLRVDLAECRDEGEGTEGRVLASEGLGSAGTFPLPVQRSNGQLEVFVR